MAKVNVKVELYYSGAWHDITAISRVLTRDPIRITRVGRVRQRPPASALSLSLLNVDGMFSPRNPMSPLYGLIGRNTPIRVSVDGDTRFSGEVAAWPQEWTRDGNNVWVPIDAAGIMRRLTAPGTAQPLRSAYYRSEMAEGPTEYWPGEDLSEALNLASANGGIPIAVDALTTPASAAPAAGTEALPALKTGARISASCTRSSATGAWQVRAVWSIPVSPAVETTLYTITTTGTARVWQLSLVPGSPDSIRVKVFDVSGAVLLNQTAFLTADADFYGKACIVSLSASTNGVNIDITQFTVASNTFAVSSDAASIASQTCGTPTSVVIDAAVGLDAAIFGHLTVLDQPSVVTGLAGGRLAGWVGELAANRLSRLCAEKGVALTIIGDVAESVPLGPQRVAPFVDLLYDAVDADMGILYEPRSFLGLEYRTGKSLYNQTPALALNYAAGGEVAPPLRPVEDWDAVANDVTVTRYQGSGVRSVQETGPLNVQEPTDDPDGVGRYEKEYTLVLASDDQPLNHAAWIKHLGTWDEARYPTVNLDLTAMLVEGKAALITQAVSLDIGDRLTIADPPAWVPPDDIDQLAQGFTEVIESHRRAIAANATPALPYEVLQISSTSGNRGRIPAGVSTLAGTMTTTSTSRTVTSPTVGWIDSAGYPAQFPFDVMVMGERMTVTAITGTASPQTFTVVRSVNGVVKTHAAGEPVQLFHPAVLAL